MGHFWQFYVDVNNQHFLMIKCNHFKSENKQVPLFLWHLYTTCIELQLIKHYQHHQHSSFLHILGGQNRKWSDTLIHTILNNVCISSSDPKGTFLPQPIQLITLKMHCIPWRQCSAAGLCSFTFGFSWVSGCTHKQTCCSLVLAILDYMKLWVGSWCTAALVSYCITTNWLALATQTTARVRPAIA